MKANDTIPFLLALIIIGAIACSGSGGTDPLATLPDCGSDPLFAVSPIASSDFVGLVPLGNLNPPGHVFPTDHIYFYTRYNTPDDSNSGRAEVPVLSPGDVRITSLTSNEHLSADPAYTDYNIFFSPCRQFKAYFYHVQSLSNAISSQAGAMDENCRTYTTGGETIRACSKDVSIDVGAGDAIGMVGGANAQALDFGAYDSRIDPLPFVDQARHDESSDGFDGLHIVCPVDYFSTDVRDALRARFGNYQGTIFRTAEPVCGEYEQDVAGTAQGNWYSTSEPETVTEDPNLALVHDNVDPAKGAFSIGTTVTSYYAGLRYFTPATSGLVNLDFDLVTADGNIHCYDNLTDSGGNPVQSTILLVQMTGETTLVIEKQGAASCGAGPWEFSSPSEFER